MISQLFEHDDDDLPLLLRLVKGRIDAGEKVYIKQRITDLHTHWGPIIRFEMVPATRLRKQCVRIIWRQGGKVGISMSETWAAETFDDFFELVKSEGVGDWTLRPAKKSVAEGIDDGMPTLAAIIASRLNQGKKVYINVMTYSQSIFSTFGEIDRISLDNADIVIINWKHITRDGGGALHTKASTFDEKYNLNKDDGGDLWLENA